MTMYNTPASVYASSAKFFDLMLRRPIYINVNRNEETFNDQKDDPGYALQLIRDLLIEGGLIADIQLLCPDFMELRVKSVANLDLFDEGATFFLHYWIDLASIDEGLKN